MFIRAVSTYAVIEFENTQEATLQQESLDAILALVGKGITKFVFDYTNVQLFSSHTVGISLALINELHENTVSITIRGLAAYNREMLGLVGLDLAKVTFE